MQGGSIPKHRTGIGNEAKQLIAKHPLPTPRRSVLAWLKADLHLPQLFSISVIDGHLIARLSSTEPISSVVGSCRKLELQYARG